MQKQAMRSCTIAAHRWHLPYPLLGCYFSCQGFYARTSVTFELDKRGQTNLCCANNNQQSELFADTNFSRRLPLLLVGVSQAASAAYCFRSLYIFLAFAFWTCSCSFACSMPSPHAHVAFTRRTADAGFACIAKHRKNHHILQPTHHPVSNCLAGVVTS